MAKTLYNPKDNLYTPDEVLKYRTPSIADEYYPKVGDQGESQYDGYLTRYDLTTPNAIQEKRAEGQGILDEVGNMFNKMIIGELVGGTLMSFGALLDPVAGFDMIAGNENDVNNAIFQVGKSISDWTEEVTPIYRDPSEEGMERFGNSSYWTSMIPSIVSAVSMMIPGKAVSSFIGLAAKAAKMGKVSSEVMGVLAGATAMRHAENYRESNGVFENAYKTALDNGMSENKAREIAAAAASTDYRMNSANLVFDILQLGSISKGFKSVMNTASGFEKAVIRAEMGIGETVTKAQKVAHYGLAGIAQVGEGVEEVINQVSQYEAERQANIESGVIKDDGSNFMDRMQTYLGKADTWDSFIWGVVGGVAFEQIGNAISKGSPEANIIKDKIKNVQNTKSILQQYDALAKEAIKEGDNLSYEAIKNNMATSMVSNHAFNGTLDVFSEWVNHEKFASEMESFGIDPSGIKEMKARINSDIEFANTEVADLAKTYRDNPDLARELLLQRFNERNANKSIQFLNEEIAKLQLDVLDADNKLGNQIGTTSTELLNKIAKQKSLEKTIEEEEKLLTEFDPNDSNAKEVINNRSRQEVEDSIEKLKEEVSTVISSISTDVMNYMQTNKTELKIEDLVTKISKDRYKLADANTALTQAIKRREDATVTYNKFKNNPEEYNTFKEKVLKEKKDREDEAAKEHEKILLEEARTSSINNPARLEHILNTVKSPEAKTEVKELLKQAKKNKNTPVSKATNPVSKEHNVGPDTYVYEEDNAVQSDFDDLQIEDDAGLFNYDEEPQKSAEENPDLSGSRFKALMEIEAERQEELDAKIFKKGHNRGRSNENLFIENNPLILSRQWPTSNIEEAEKLIKLYQEINVKYDAKVKALDEENLGLTGNNTEFVNSLNEQESERIGIKTDTVSIAYLDKKYTKKEITLTDGTKGHILQDVIEDGKIVLNMTSREQNLPDTYLPGQKLIFFVDTSLEGSYGHEANKDNPNTIPIAIQTEEDYKAKRKPVMYMHTMDWVAVTDDKGNPIKKDGVFVPSDKIDPANAQTIIKEHLAMREHIFNNMLSVNSTGNKVPTIFTGEVTDKRKGALNIVKDENGEILSNNKLVETFANDPRVIYAIATNKVTEPLIDDSKKEAVSNWIEQGITSSISAGMPIIFVPTANGKYVPTFVHNNKVKESKQGKQILDTVLEMLYTYVRDSKQMEDLGVKTVKDLELEVRKYVLSLEKEITLNTNVEQIFKVYQGADGNLYVKLRKFMYERSPDGSLKLTFPTGTSLTTTFNLTKSFANDKNGYSKRFFSEIFKQLLQDKIATVTKDILKPEGFSHIEFKDGKLERVEKNYLEFLDEYDLVTTSIQNIPVNGINTYTSQPLIEYSLDYSEVIPLEEEDEAEVFTGEDTEEVTGEVTLDIVDNSITEDDKYVLKSFDILDKILKEEDLGLTGKEDPTNTTLSQQYVEDDITWHEQTENINSMFVQTINTIHTFNALADKYTKATIEERKGIIKELKSLRIKYVIDEKTGTISKISSNEAFNSVIERLKVLKSIYAKLGKTAFEKGVDSILNNIENKYSESKELEHFGYRHYIEGRFENINYEFLLAEEDTLDAYEKKEDNITYDELFLKNDPENSVTSEVKMHLAKVKVIDYNGQAASTSSGLNKYYGNGHAYNYLVYALSDIPYRFIEQELNALASRDNAFMMREIKKIYDKMSHKERNQFLKVLKKDTYVYKTLIHKVSVTESTTSAGEPVTTRYVNHNVRNTNNSGSEERVVDSWKENYRIIAALNGLLDINETGAISFNETKRKEYEVRFRELVKDSSDVPLVEMGETAVARLIGLLDAYGIQVTALEIDTLRRNFLYGLKDKMRQNPKYVPKVNDFLNSSFNYIFTNKVADLYTEQSGVIKTIAKAFVTNNPSIYSSAYRNGRGDKVYGHGAGSFLTTTMNEFKYNANFLNTYRLDGFSKHSWIFDFMDNPNGREVMPKVYFTDIMKDSSSELDPKSFEEAPDADKEYARLMTSQYHGSKNTSVNMLSPCADKTRFPIIELPRISIDEDVHSKGIVFNDDFTITVSKDSATTAFYYKAVLGEINRINDFAKQLYEYERSISTGKVVDFDVLLNYHTKAQAGKYFHIFPKLNDILKDYLIKNNNPDAGLYKGQLDGDLIIKELILQHIAEEVSTMMSEKAKSWIEYNIYNNTTKELNFESRYMKRVRGENKLTQEQLFLYGVADFTVNSSAALIFDLHFITGDPAQYADTKAGTWEDVIGNSPKSSLVNIFKRTAGNIAPGYQIFKEIEQYKIMAIEEPVFTSLLSTALESIGSKIARANENIKLFDAQELITKEEYFKELLAEGIITEEQRDKYLALKHTDPIPEELQKIILQPRKPVQNGMRWSESLKKNVKTYIKSSSFPLLDGLVYDTPLQDIAKFMNENGVDRLVAPTAFKIGCPLPLAITKDGKFVNFAELNKDLVNKSIVTLTRDMYRIQQEIPYDETKHSILEGSQLRKLRFANLEMDFKFFLNGVEKTAEQLKTLDDNIHLTKYNRKLEKVLDMLGVVKKLNGEYAIEDMTVLKNFIIEEASKRDLGDDMLRMLRTVEFNNKTLFDIPLLYHPMSSMIESLLNSIVKNKILKNKIPGHSYVQVSSFGFYNKEEGTVQEFKNQNGIVWLKGHNNKRSLDYIMGKNEQGEEYLQHAEVIIPFYFVHNGERLKLSDYLLEDGTLDESKIDPKLLESIGYRIPTSNHSSMVKLKVVGFLPDTVDNSVIVPAAITTQQGSDFDVDKLYVHFHPFSRNKKGNLSSIKYSLDTSETSIKQRYEGIYNKILTKKAALNTIEMLGIDEVMELIEEYDTFSILGLDGDALEKLLKPLLTKDSENVEESLITISEAIRKKTIPSYEDFAKLSIEEQLTDNQLDALYMDITTSILNNPLVSKGSLDAITDDGLQDAIKHLGTLKPKTTKAYDVTKASTCTGLLNTNHHNYVVKANAFGKMGVGMFSSLSVNHILFQWGNVHLGYKKNRKEEIIAKDYEVLFTDKGKILRHFTDDNNRVKDGNYSDVNSVPMGAWRLDSIYGFNGRKISLVISNLQNAAVDIAKENYLSPLNINAQTASVAGLLARLGFDETLIGLFLTQPVIYEYLEKTESMFKILKDKDDNTSVEDIKRELLAKYGKDIQDNISSIDTTELEDSLKDTLTAEQLKDLQGRVLLNFLKYNDIAREIGAVQNIINVDTKYLDKNIYSSVLKSHKKTRIIDGHRKYYVKNTPNLLNGTVQGRALEIMDIMTEIFTKENLIPIDVGSSVGNIVQTIMTHTGTNLVTTNQDKILEITNEVLKAIRGTVYSKVALDLFGTTYGENIVDIREKLVKGENSVGAIIARIKNQYSKDANAKINSFLNSITVVSPDTRQDYYTLKFTATNSVKEEASKNNTMGWLELLNSNDPEMVQLGERLIMYSLAFGNDRNAIDIGKFMPSDYLFKIDLGDKIRKFHSQIEESSFDIIRQYFRHNVDRAITISRKDMDKANDKKKLLVNYYKEGQKLTTDRTPYYFYLEDVALKAVTKPQLMVQDINGVHMVPIYFKYFSKAHDRYVLYERILTSDGKTKYLLCNELGDSYHNEYGDNDISIRSVFQQNIYAGYGKLSPFVQNQRVNDTMVVPKIGETYNVKPNGFSIDVLKAVMEKSSSPITRALAEHFLTNFEKEIGDFRILLDVTLKDGMAVNIGQRLLKYNPAYKSTLKQKYNIDIESQTGFEEAILHEHAHIVLHDRIENKENQSKEIKLAITNLENLFEFLKKDHTFVASLSKEELLAFKDIHEFTSRVLSNATFRDKLNNKPYGKKTFLEKIFELITKIFGIDVNKDSALAEGLENIFMIMDSPMVETTEIKNTTTSNIEDQLSPIEREYTPENITSLKPNEVFVFGSNAEGVHGKGAALTAKQKFGAKQGQSEGLQGQSYAIITKKNWRVEKSSTLNDIFQGIEKFLQFAKNNPNKKFLVTKLGSSLAGYTIEEIKGIFNNANNIENIPDNVILPKEYEVRGNPDNKNKSLNQSIYSKLGNKTKSKNVVIKPWSELKDIKELITPEGIISTRVGVRDEHFGNPFSSNENVLNKNTSLIRAESTKDAVEKYIDWILTGRLPGYLDSNIDVVETDLRRDWIVEQLKSDKLKGLPILYYKELGEPSHATALDYLINEYNWNENKPKPGEQLTLDLQLTGNLGMNIHDLMKTLPKEQREILRQELNNGNIKTKCK